MATLKVHAMASTQKIVTAAEMQAIEERWFASGEITLEGLMDRVGRAIADWALNDLGDDVSNSSVLALAGKGNNGGDAIVAARYLVEAGVDTTVVIVISRPDDDPLLADFIEAGGTVLN